MDFPTHLPSRLAAISHEIRTPLTVITGYAQILLARETDSEKKAWCQSILNSSRLVERLINDILQVSKEGSEMFKTELVPTEVRREIGEVCDLLRVKAEEKGIRFEYIPSDDRPLNVLTDAIRLKQILFNLIGNAIKFTNVGHVIVRDQLLDPEPSRPHRMFQISVEDTGGGIDDVDLKNIFTPFYQSQMDRYKSLEGTGLGLSISRSLAQALGGDVELQSTTQEGSIFNLTIGAAFPSAEEEGSGRDDSPLRDREKPDHMRLAGMNICIADDAEEILSILRHVLEGQGAQVTTATDGLRALEILRGQAYDVVILDIEMPGLDGYQITKKLRAENYPQPIIALTAHQIEKEENLYKAAGFTSQMTKPINFEKLITLLEHFKKPQSEALVEASAMIDEARSENEIADHENKPHVLLVEDDNDLGLLTSIYLNESGYDSTIAQTLNRARQEFWKQRFDFILLDLILPDGRGTDLLSDSSSSPNWNTPVIVASGNLSDRELANPRISRVFRKPYDMQQLISYLREAS